MKKGLLLAILVLVFFIPTKSYANPKREMRATWLTAVANIDWPVSTTKGMEAQQKELIGLLDKCVEFRMNTVLLHIRPACDALYKSSYEPWSSYLNNGRGVDPGWDPLQFCIDECHKRGLTCHGWINPYRYGKRQVRSSYHVLDSDSALLWHICNLQDYTGHLPHTRHTDLASPAISSLCATEQALDTTHVVAEMQFVW